MKRSIFADNSLFQAGTHPNYLVFIIGFQGIDNLLIVRFTPLTISVS